MNRQRWIILVTVLVALGAFLVIQRWRPPEPTNQGRRLSQWLPELDADTREQRDQARAAIRQMGDAVLPFLLQIIKEDEVPATTEGDRAYNALIALADTHPAALEALKELLYRRFTSTDAALSLVVLDGDGLSEVTNAATQAPPVIRTAALAALGARVDVPAISLPPLVAALKAEERGVRQMALISLRGFNAASEPVILSAVTELLTDEHPRVRADAARTLGTFGSSAKTAMPMLKTAAQDTNEAVRLAAEAAMKRITSETAQ
jgi:HEAT repeat protein